MTYSWDHRVESYPSYLSNRARLDEQVRGMKDAGERTAREIVGGISAQSADILGSMDSMSSMLSADLGALSAGIESGLGHVAGVLEDGFAGLLRKSDEIKQELQRLVELVELEEQKKAMENFRYAVFALNRQLWDEALEYVTAAIEGDAHSKGYKLDWHFHWVKGELLLGAPARHDWSGLDPAAAEAAFLLAARYAKADEPKEAAKSLLMASVAAFAQSHDAPAKLADMLEHAEAAYALDTNLTEASFQTAKAHMALGAPDRALPVLRRAIDGDVAFALRAAEDPDHRRHEDRLNAFFEALKQEKLRELTPRAKAVVDRHVAPLAKSKGLVASEAAVRLRSLADGSATRWTLLDLLDYGASGLAADEAALTAQVERLRSTIRVERRMTTERWQEEVEIDEEYEVDEPYSEDVVIKPARWWRSAVKETIEGVRKVWRTRSVLRTVERCREREWIVLLDGFGDEVEGSRPDAFVELPAGRFLMGSADSDSEAFDSEKPQHEVVISRPFALGACPVTQSVYEALIGSNPSHFKGADKPVEHVSWLDAVTYCNALSRASGLEEAYTINGEAVSWKGLVCPGYRLPTEAEWEYACRAGTTTPRYGDVDAVAWYDGNSGKETHPVGRRQANPWGLYDMLGNVWEWCWDWHTSYVANTVTDPTGPESGSRRVYRGGSWFFDARNARAASRLYWAPGYRNGLLGFRVARSLP